MDKQITHTDILPEEPMLMEALVDGSEDAYKALFYWYYPRLVRYVIPLADSRPEAEEAVQDALFKLWTKRETMIGIESPRQYLRRMVKNQLLDNKKREITEQRYRKEYTTTDTTPATAEADFTFKEYLAVAAEAIERLPPKQKEIFVLRHTQGKTIGEIAEITGSSKDAVIRNLNRAVNYIKDYLRNNSEWFGVFFSIWAGLKK